VVHEGVKELNKRAEAADVVLFRAVDGFGQLEIVWDKDEDWTGDGIFFGVECQSIGDTELKQGKIK